MSINKLSWSQAKQTITLIEQQDPNSEHIKQLHDGLLTDLIQGIVFGKLPSRYEIRSFYGLSNFSEGNQKSSPWTTDEEGNIHFTVVSNGFTPKQCETDLKKRGFRISKWGRSVLLSATEAPTNGVLYKIVVRPIKKIGKNNRVSNKIREYAETKCWQIPHWEIAYLIRITFTDEQLEQMGLWYIVTMHKPIVGFDGDLGLLSSDRSCGGRFLSAGYGRSFDIWDIDCGFAFVASQVVPKNLVF